MKNHHPLPISFTIENHWIWLFCFLELVICFWNTWITYFCVYENEKPPKGMAKGRCDFYFNEYSDFGIWRLISIRSNSVLILLDIAFDVARYFIACIFISVNCVDKSIHFVTLAFWKHSLEMYHFLFVLSKHLARINLWSQTKTLL